MNFEELYKSHWEKVFRLCMGYTNDIDLAKDLAQETFIKVWRKLPEFRSESAVETWIFRIATNTCLREMQKEKKMPKAELPLEMKEEAVGINMESYLPYLYQCISELPEIERIIISLELEDVGQKEIAKIIGISAVNVRVKIHRIKGRLARKFKEYEL